MAKVVEKAISKAMKGLLKVRDVILNQQGDYPYKMLLVGETGSGKTSFLNLLCNYNLVLTLGYEVGVEQFHEFNDISLENARSKQMESKTDDAKMYTVEFGELKIGVVDTPGFGDSRGMKVDKDNVKKIIEALKVVEYINCVCLIINGRLSRMSATLRYVLTEVTAILPKEVLNNVIVVFTNTADPLEFNFDIGTLTEFFGKDIENYFFIENPYCKFEKAKLAQRKQSIPQAQIAKSLKKAFNETADTLEDMFEIMKNFKQVHTHHFTHLYEQKQKIERNILELLVAYDNQTFVEKEIAKAQEELDSAIRQKNLNDKYESTQTIKKWITVKTSRHNTLCGARECYHLCHEECGLNKSFGKQAFLGCACMNGEYCRECGHHYTYHYHDEIRFDLDTYEQPLIDEDMQKQFNEASNNVDEIERIIRTKLKKQKEESIDKKRALSRQLRLTIDEFQKLGVSRNYIKVMENQLAVVNHRLEGSTGEEASDLREMKEAIEKKIKVVQEELSSQ